MPTLQLDNNLIKDLYINKFCTAKEIAKIIGVHHVTVHKRLNEMGIMRDNHNRLKVQYERGIRKPALLKATDDEIKRLYQDEKLTPNQIAKCLGYKGSSNIVERLRKLNILEVREKRVLRGEENPSWKGGIIKVIGGYIQVKKPNHHRAGKNGYVFEHIVVWEQYHQKELPAGLVIHHINGIKDDNRPENLLAMPKGKHDTLIPRMAKRIRELEIENKQLKKALENSQAIFYISEN